uniref:Uncharacterized protein n=1 Tax=Arundo donax TaxID=35708 RepID=A0A0A9F1E0_ARUDO
MPLSSLGTLPTLSRHPSALATDAKMGSVAMAMAALVSSSACTTWRTPGWRSRTSRAASARTRSRKASSAALDSPARARTSASARLSSTQTETTG